MDKVIFDTAKAKLDEYNNLFTPLWDACVLAIEEFVKSLDGKTYYIGDKTIGTSDEIEICDSCGEIRVLDRIFLDPVTNDIVLELAPTEDELELFISVDNEIVPLEFGYVKLDEIVTIFQYIVDNEL